MTMHDVIVILGLVLALLGTSYATHHAWSQATDDAVWLLTTDQHEQRQRDIAWWRDARFSVIPVERFVAHEMVLDWYGQETPRPPLG
jgi:hypothetical protein